MKDEMEQAERDKVLVEAELAEVTEEIRLLTKTRVNQERVREVLADFRLLYEVATGKERGELIRLLFRRIEYNGPNEQVHVEFWDRTKRNLELEGSRFQTSWLARKSVRPTNFLRFWEKFNVVSVKKRCDATRLSTFLGVTSRLALKGNFSLR